MTEETETAPKAANPIVVLRQSINQMQPEISAALPPHIKPEKFARVAMTAIQNDPALVGADRKSLFGSIIRLAQDGLLPDGREAALVIFNTKKGNGWVKAVQAMPMIAGILKRIRQSGEVAKVSAQVVHENDTFVVKYGFDEDVEHSPPPLDQPRGKPIGAYATAVLKDGSRLLEVMSLEEIEKVRAVSKSGDKGPWASWWGEMARKTVMRRLSKRLPMSTDLEEQIFSRDETLAMDPRAFSVAPASEEEAPRLTSKLDAIEAQCEDADTIDAETGEVLEAEDQAAENPSDLAAEKANELIGRINDAATIVDLKAIEKEADLHLPGMDESLSAAIESAIDVARARLTKKAEPVDA